MVDAYIEGNAQSPRSVIGNVYKKSNTWMGISQDKKYNVNESNAKYNTTAKPFFSKLQRTIEVKMPNKASIEDIRNLIYANGVKMDEIKWSGINDFLRGNDKVSKSELLVFLKMNELQINEITKREVEDKYKFMYELAEKYQTTLANLPNVINEEEKAKLDELNNIKDSERTKFSQYTLPRGENYQELLFALPTERNIPKIYKSDHWDEPNILAHVRFNDRVDTEGNKILFIEEVQSDWHQEGKRNGYNGEFEANRKQFKDFLESKGVKIDDGGISYGILEENGASEEMLNDFHNYMRSIKGIPGTNLY